MAWSNEQTRTSTVEHKRWAAAVKRRARGCCELQYDGCTGRADHADHITPVGEGGAEHDVANGQGACDHCHGIKTRAEAARGRRRYYGQARRKPERHPGLL